MKLIIVFLAIALVFLWNKVKTMEEDAKEEKKKHLETVEKQNAAFFLAVQEKEKAQTQVASYENEVNRLKTALEETQRRLDFYKNIDKDSGSLNAPDDSEERENLLKQITQQIIENQEQTDSTAQIEPNQPQNTFPILDAEQSFARNEIENSKRNFFITGKAGTGKSFLLDVFRKTTRKSSIVLAPTGIAALNVNGATLHSTFGFSNLVNLDVEQITEKEIKLKSEKKIMLKKVSTIIIDEISMVRADTFDKIDRILKVINDNNLPFGGKQIVLFGDLFQLPPITKTPEYKYLYDRYGGIYFFCSDAYKNGNFQFMELTINHRQKDDDNYFALLNRVREGIITAEDLSLLNSRVTRDMSIYDRFTTLLPKKEDVEKLNQYHIDQLDSKEYVYKAIITLDNYPQKIHHIETIFPIASMLRLKKGALVMMVANDIGHRWVNGTLGIVKNLSEDRISVAINGRVYEVNPIEFSEQEITYVNGRITYEDVLKVAQFPIVPAYAMTIHKSQGQTYQNIVCDIDKCFANGQAYVALSRCASLNGLHLKKQISGTSILVDKSVLNFYQKQTREVEEKV